ncbi:MAG: transport between ER and Golgi ATPase protein [Trizodia sp. TS-e1964]|nr:MAG: transport between ER and Golgi ATPase protein [Trizodia sp. TS-e1964]
MSALDPIFTDTSTASPPINPYDAVLSACSNDPVIPPKAQPTFRSAHPLTFFQIQIQTHYTTHRTDRNEQQHALLLSPTFPGPTIDPTLARLTDPALLPPYTDPRHCLVFWARPPTHIRTLAAKLQHALRATMPHLWLMPLPNLHMTALEITHSRSAPEIAALLAQLGPAAAAIANYTRAHRARLVKPMLSYDAAAIALSFVPAAGEGAQAGEGLDDSYTYHHLRRDLWRASSAAGVRVASRYVAPSAHITVARFLQEEDFQGDGVRALVGKIEALNAWLRAEYWPREGGVPEGGEWVVGQEKGLDCRAGTLWYGGGETLVLGEGF